LGGRLLSEAVRRSGDFGLKTLLGFIFAHNEPESRLFEKLGFRDGLLPRVAESRRRRARSRDRRAAIGDSAVSPRCASAYQLSSAGCRRKRVLGRLGGAGEAPPMVQVRRARNACWGRFGGAGEALR